MLCITKHGRGDARAVGLAAATGAVAAAAVNETILNTCFRFIFDQIS